MTRDLWVPGAAPPSLEDFVQRIHRQIEGFTATHSAESSHVEVELRDGHRLTLRALSSEPGYGFITLAVHSPEDEAELLIVPVGAISRISLGPADEARRPGFALPPQGEGPGSAA